MQIVLQGLRQIGLENDRVLDQNLETTVAMLQTSRMQIPDRDEQLSYVDKALLPLLQLHRVAYQKSSVEQQLEPSELDLLSFGITEADLFSTAEALGVQHLGNVPVDEMATGNGLIVGTKRRLLVPRTLTLNNITCTVMFLLDNGAPVTYVCHRTLAKFGLSSKQLEAQPGNVCEVHCKVWVRLCTCLTQRDLTMT